jgi:predicted NAD/FAD-dependent oxidoreductase
MRVALIGAGVAGAALCNFLGDKSDKIEITVFEKSRGPGGRMAYRKHEDFWLDHGAVCFGASRSLAFINFVKNNRDIICPWNGKFYQVNNLINQRIISEDKDRLVCVPHSNALVKRLLGETKILSSKKVVKLTQTQSKWDVYCEDETVYTGFDIVISSAPAPQTADIFPKEFKFYNVFEQTQYFSTFALMIAGEFDKSVNFAHLGFKNSILSRISYENSKPMRDFKLDAFLIHSSNEFAAQNLEMDKEEIGEILLSEFVKETDISPQHLAYKSVHRWLYANPTQHFSDEAVLFDESLNLGIIGDFTTQARVEMAFESGLKMANFIKEARK